MAAKKQLYQDYSVYPDTTAFFIVFMLLR